MATRADIERAVASLGGRAPKAPRKPRVVPSYRRAIAWIIDNDDTDWLEDDEPIISVSAVLVADMFGKEDAQVIADLRRALKRKEG